MNSKQTSEILQGIGSFEHVWPRLELIINKIFATESIPQKEWHDTFYDVYKLCAWDMNLAHQLQDRLRHSIQRYMNGERLFLENRSQDIITLCKAYMAAWQRFMYFYDYVPLPFTPLERFFARAPRTSVPTATCLPKKKKNIERFIQFTLNEMWIATIFNDFGTKLVNGATHMVDSERNSEPYDPELIIGIKNSCIHLGTFFQDKLYFYRNNFERVYIVQAIEHYRKKSNEIFIENGVLRFMEWVDIMLKDEADRANRYLEPHSLSKLTSALVFVLITGYKEQMIEKFDDLLKERDVQRMHLLFQLLNRMPDNGVNPIQDIFQSHVLNDSKEKMLMEAPSLTMDAERYVEFLFDRYNQATDLIYRAFEVDPRFFTARDIAFNELVNDLEVFKTAQKWRIANTFDYEDMSRSTANLNHLNENEQFSTQMSSLSNKFESLEVAQANRAVDFKSVELFANYTDLLLRKTNLSRRLTSEELDSRLKNVITLLKYITNKDIFMKFYKTHLTRRMLMDTSGDNDKEEVMVGLLRNIGMPAEFINKISRMFQDMKISDDLNYAYREYIRKNGCASSVTDIVTFKILNSSAWSRNNEKLNFSLPQEIEKVLPYFESYYNLTHNGRNLQWQYPLSTGVVTYHSDCGDYDLDVTSYQLCLLQCWNDKPQAKITLEALGLYTNLSNVDLRRTIWSLVTNIKMKEQLILSDMKYDNMREFKDTSSFQLNLKFALAGRNGRQMKRGRINYIGRLVLHTERSREEDLKNIYNLRSLRVQEAITKILKSRQTLLFNALYFEVVEILRHMFLPTKELIAEQLEEMLHNELIMQDPKEPDRYTYSA